jgi:hypothetical protein
MMMIEKRSCQNLEVSKEIPIFNLIITNKSNLMKNLVFLFLVSVFLVSCGGSADSASVASDSTVVADSLVDSTCANPACVDTLKK